MKNKIKLLKRQIIYDMKIILSFQHKRHLIFIIIIVFLFMLFHRKVNGYTAILEDDGIGFWDYLIYIFCGKNKMNNLTQLDIFDMPVEWLLIHSYILLAVGTYPKVEYGERGYQFLLRAGNKWCWWISKGFYIITDVMLYYFSIMLVALVFSILNGTSINNINKDILYYVFGIDGSKLTMNDIVRSTVIMPLLIIIALCITLMFISFVVNIMISVIILLAYLSVSAYWCSKWLLGNYTMVLRTDEVPFVAGVLIACGITVIFFLWGYLYFNQMDMIGKQREEMI